MQWKAVISMAFTTFVLVSSEFMPVSLLTSIASEFGVSEGQIGFYSISISGTFSLISSLFISTIAGNIDRKKNSLEPNCVNDHIKCNGCIFS